MRDVFSTALLIVGLTHGTLIASSPREDLLKRVPPDVGFIVMVNDLRGFFDRAQNSPFAKKYLTTRRGQAALASPEWEQLKAFNDLLKKEIGADWPELRDGILGDAIVFLYVPGPPEHPEQEQSLVLIHARDPKLAERIYAFIDAAQSKSGQLKEKTSLTRGAANYVKRVRTDEGDEFSYLNGPVIAFGNSEKLLQTVIDRDQKPERSAVTDELDRLGVLSASMVWWVNPRAFDQVMAAQQKKEAGPAAAGLAAINRHWKALDGIALSYHLHHNSELRLSFAARPDAMPAATRQFLNELATPSTLSAIFPSDALLTVTGRVSIPAALNLGAEFLPEVARQQLGLAMQKSIGAVLGSDVITALPNRLGPDWGISVMAPPAGSACRWPIGLAAIRLSDAANGPAVLSRVMDGLNALATLAVVGFNSKNSDTISIQFEQQDNVLVKFIVPPKEVPADVRPAFAWKDGYVLVASHPDGIRNFTAKNQPPKAEAAVAPILQVNLPAWAAYLRRNRDMAIGLLTKQAGQTTDSANRQLDAALEVLDLFRGVALTVQAEPGRAVVSLQIQPVESFVRPEK